MNTFTVLHDNSPAEGYKFSDLKQAIHRVYVDLMFSQEDGNVDEAKIEIDIPGEHHLNIVFYASDTGIEVCIGCDETEYAWSHDTDAIVDRMLAFATMNRTQCTEICER